MTMRWLMAGGCVTALASIAAAQGSLTDRTIASAGTTIHLRCGGSRAAAAPLVLLEAGAGGGADSWSPVLATIAEFARVCAYDRPGTGASGDYPFGLKAVDHAGFLRGALQAAGEKPPYVMVGHSFGGIIVSLYAMSYPADVVGMLLVDSSHEDQIEKMAAITGPPPPPRIPATPPPGVPPPPPPGLRMPDFSAELKKTPFRGDIPVVVLTAGRVPTDATEIKIQPLWLELQKDLASRSSKSEHRVLPSAGHIVQRDDPQAVVDAIKRVMTWR